MNKRGLTLVELIVSMALISVVMLFMYKLLADVTFEKDNDFFSSLNQNSRIEITKEIEEYIYANEIESVTVDTNIIKLKDINDNEMNISIAEDGKSLTFNDKKWTIKLGKYLSPECYTEEIAEADRNKEYKMITCSIKVVTSNNDNTRDNNNKIDDIEFTVIYKTKDSLPDTEKEILPESFATDSWSTILKNQSFYEVGDTRCIELENFTTTNDNGCGTSGVAHHGFKIKIVNNSTPDECATSGFSQTACGFVIQFEDIIMKAPMNSTNTNSGGWPGSKLYNFLNITGDYKASDIPTGYGEYAIYNSLPEELQNIIIDTTVISSHGKIDSYNYTSNNNKLYLLDCLEIFPSSSCKVDSITDLTRQLDYYNENVYGSAATYVTKYYNSTTTATAYWLRTANKNENTVFAWINNKGVLKTSNNNSNVATGVLPAFRIGEKNE